MIVWHQTKHTLYLFLILTKKKILFLPLVIKMVHNHFCLVNYHLGDLPSLCNIRKRASPSCSEDDWYASGCSVEPGRHSQMPLPVLQEPVHSGHHSHGCRSFHCDKCHRCNKIWVSKFLHKSIPQFWSGLKMLWDIGKKYYNKPIRYDKIDWYIYIYKYHCHPYCGHDMCRWL